MVYGHTFNTHLQQHHVVINFIIFCICVRFQLNLIALLIPVIYFLFFHFNCFILKMLAGNSTPKEKENNKHEKQKERDNEMFVQASNSAPPVHHRTPRSLGKFQAWINKIDKKNFNISLEKSMRNEIMKGYKKFESHEMTAGYFMNDVTLIILLWLIYEFFMWY